MANVTQVNGHQQAYTTEPDTALISRKMRRPSADILCGRPFIKLCNPDPEL